jgi:hypothetical protein
MMVDATTGSCEASPYSATVTEGEDGTTTTSTGTQYSISCGSNGGSSLYGYWTMPANGGYVTINGVSNSTATAGMSLIQSYFHQFAPGSYTIVAEDMWNQTVFAHFEVIAAVTTGTTGASSAGSIFTVTFQQAGTCSPTIYAPKWSVTLGNVTKSAQTNNTASNTAYAEPLPPPPIVFSVTNGVYQYSVSPSNDEFQPASGTVTVNGANVVVVVAGPVTSCTAVATG